MNKRKASVILDQILSEYPRDLSKPIREQLIQAALNGLANTHATHIDFRMKQADVFVESYLDHQVSKLIGV